MVGIHPWVYIPGIHPGYTILHLSRTCRTAARYGRRGLTAL